MKRKKQIIHLDNNPVVLNLIKLLINEYFEQNIIEYIAVETQQELETLLLKEVPDILITDLIGEDEQDPSSRVNLIKIIHTQYSKIKIFVLSSSTNQETQQKLKPYISHYAYKSGDPTIFLNLLKTLLEE